MNGSLSAVESATNLSPVVATSRPEIGRAQPLPPGRHWPPSRSTAVAELEGTGGGVHDVGYQECRHHSVEATALGERANAVLGCQSIVIHGSSPTTQESWPGGTS